MSHNTDNEGVSIIASQFHLEALSKSLAEDLPLLMHGSGDVHPSLVNPATVSVLALLTGNYIHDLVDAAVDAHDILMNGAGGICPPPPPVYSDENNSHKKRKRKVEEDWEQPLPIPKIRRGANGNNGAVSFPITPYQPLNQPLKGNDLNDSNSELTFKAEVLPEEWQGVRGIDLYARRIRNKYTSLPTTIGTQSFIFPICHDAILYGRVMEVQAARRNLASVLVDPVMAKCIEDEGMDVLGETMYGWIDDEETSYGDKEASKEKKTELAKRVNCKAQWPGLEDLLPTRRFS